MGGRSLIKPFAGYPASAAATVLPNLFFSSVLPEIERVEELIVSLYFFFLQGRKRGSPRVILEDELVAERVLMQTLANFNDDPKVALASGLEMAVERGTVIRDRDNDKRVIYLLNTPAHQRQVSGVQVILEEEASLPVQAERKDSSLALISQLYEDNVGVITPLIADELKEASERYREHQGWIEAAFREAAKANVRSWKYIQRILERWEAEGPDYEAIRRDPQSNSSAGRPLSGRYRHLFRR